jgi:hypothetical protein
VNAHRFFMISSWTTTSKEEVPLERNRILSRGISMRYI